MNNINILDSSIFNRIAAGEVVESPHSVVKELVENSIDAKAAEITIEVKNGGIDYISVCDNGFGVSGEDICKAFLPHATSKIKTIDDLNAIGSLGFRGEALPSIASVATVSMVSRQKGSDTGYKAVYCNGEFKGKSEVGAPFGTTVTVKNLFEKIPARKKFLSKPNSEANKITDLIKKLILANPDVSFTYILDGKTVYNTDGGGIESAVYSIYGADTENMEYISHQLPHITIKGFISKVEFSKHNRNYQTLIVNNRVVECADISYSVFLAYKDFLLPKRFPLFVLYIDIPFDLVDVNVHPNKLTVKFVDITSVKKTIYNKIHTTLTKTAGTAFIANEAQPVGASVPDRPNTEIGGTEYAFNPINFETPIQLHEAPAQPQTQFTRQSIFDLAGINDAVGSAIGRPQNPNDAVGAGVPDRPHNDLPIRIIGSLFDTYLIIQLNDDIYFIDQHAAHERLLYDKLINQTDSGQIIRQDMLVPYMFTLSGNESEYLDQIKDQLNDLGFTISQFAPNTYSLSSVPLVMSDINFASFIAGLFENTVSQIKNSAILKDKLAQLACKSAVKAGDKLSDTEINALIDQMIASNTIPLCPHGRPAIIKYTKSDIEKWFKRKI